MIRLFAYFTRRPDPVDALIAEKAARVKFTGFDPALRQRTEEKRKEAERLKRRAGRIASEPPTERTLRRVL